MAKVRGFVIPKRRVVLFFVVLALIIGSGVWYSVDSFRRAEQRRREAFDNVTATALLRIAEFAVLEYVYTDVVELSRSFPIGGASSSLVRFSGVVKAGIADVERIVVTPDPEAGRVRVVLPRAEILENTVDVSTVKFWDLKKNIFVPISTELKIQEVTLFKDRVQQELMDSGFLADADTRARDLVASLYAGFGMDVAVEWE
ncbi:MAG TPA: DUF4230 domain-containing protein [Treponemataceae bacterium]|nr:DUF4230 domain-containing protein [Treponemataceae bacterium]HOS36456.1 DUF4230 domain-containing protein [Treponemataceae bacterium]HRR03277.1 DUF4230 domain-containing protein [Treponemataceae bacterium]